MRIVEDIYKVTHDFPNEERFGLTSQIRRAAVSIPSNIAEGSKRNSDKEFKHFLGISRGSAAEVETQLELASRLGYITKDLSINLQKDLDTMQRMITNFQLRL